MLYRCFAKEMEPICGSLVDFSTTSLLTICEFRVRDCNPVCCATKYSYCLADKNANTYIQ